MEYINLGGKLKLGIAPTRRRMYDKKYAFEFRDSMLKKIEEFKDPDTDYIGIADIVDEGLMQTSEDVDAAAERFKAQGVDALFMPLCNFGTEECVAMLGKKMGVPVLLWGPRDPAPIGEEVRQSDVQCGLFAASKALQRYGVAFTYIENCAVDDQKFEDGFKSFLATAQVVKTFRSMRIGVMSQRPKPFLSVIHNEGELLDKFGIELVPVDIMQIIKRGHDILDNERELVAPMKKDIEARLNTSEMDNERIWNIVATEQALMEFAQKERCQVMATYCWSYLATSMKVPFCFIIADLTNRGLPVACETDVLGAVTSAMLTSAVRGRMPTFFADLTIRHPENDNSELLWHCGPFPTDLARYPDKAKLVNGRGFYELKHGEVTLARVDSHKGEYTMFIGNAKGIEGPKTNGGYLWVEVDDWPKWERKLIEGPYIHHIVGVHSQVADIMREACKYIPQLRPDPV